MSRAPRIAIAGGLVLLALAALALALLASFDWNQAKPWLQRKVEQASGRSLEIGGPLTLAWHAPQGEPGWRAWVPWPRLQAQDVVFGNAEWSAQPVMARARALSFSLNPLALLEQRILIPTLTLDAPQILLERGADGRDNWSLSERDGGWQTVVQRIAVNGGSIVVDDAVRQLSLRAEAEAAGSGVLHWRARGRMQGEALEATGSSADLLELQDEQAHFPLTVQLRSGSTSIDATGNLSGPRTRLGLDLQLQVSGVSMAKLYALTGLPLPETPPFATAGRLQAAREEAGLRWAYENFSGKMGATDMRGTLRYQPGEPRLLEGRVESRLLRVADLAPLVGVDSAASRKRRGERHVQPRGKIFPAAPFRSERWKNIDINVELRAAKAVRRQELPVDDLFAQVRLRQGVLRIAPLQFGAAGGRFESQIILDGRRKPVRGEMTLSARRLKLARLLPAVPDAAPGSGELNADARLRGSGNSIAGLLGAADGELTTAIDRGTLSKLLLDRMGMNFGSMLLAQMFGDRQVEIRCAAGDFVLEKGVLRPRAFVVDTEQANIYLDGKIRLGEERLELVVHPQSKGLQLLSLRTPLSLRGSFTQPELEADHGMLALRAGSALALAALAPLGAALLPLLEVGPGESNECASLMASAAP